MKERMYASLQKNVTSLEAARGQGIGAKTGWQSLALKKQGRI